MEFKGRVIDILPVKSGNKKDGGTWASREYVIENNESKYPKKMCFAILGQDKIDQENIKIGEDLNVSFDIDARQWQDRWFNSIIAWKIDRIGGAQNQPAQQNTAPITDDGNSDLPF